MKKRLFSAVLALLFSVACSVMAVAATSGGDEADEVVRAGGFLFHFNRDRTALSLWFCNRADRNMTLPDKVYYDGTTKEASLKPVRQRLTLWKSSKSARSEATPIYSPSPFQPRIAPWAAPPL